MEGYNPPYIWKTSAHDGLLPVSNFSDDAVADPKNKKGQSGSPEKKVVLEQTVFGEEGKEGDVP